MAQVIADMLPLYDRTPAPICMEVLAQDVDGRVCRCGLSASHFGRTCALTRSIGEHRPLHCRPNRSDPGHVLRGGEVEAHLGLVLGERVTAAVHRDMRR